MSETVDPELIQLLNSEREASTDDPDEPLPGWNATPLKDLIDNSEKEEKRAKARALRAAKAKEKKERGAEATRIQQEEHRRRAMENAEAYKQQQQARAAAAAPSPPPGWENRPQACVRCGTTMVAGGELVYAAPAPDRGFPGGFYCLCRLCSVGLQHEADTLAGRMLVPGRLQERPVEPVEPGRPPQTPTAWHCPGCGGWWAPSVAGCPRCNAR